MTGKRFTPALPGKLEDPTLERLKQNTDRQIKELQAVPVAGALLFRDVELPDNVEVGIPHNFGRKAFVLVSPPNATVSSTPGRIRYRPAPELFDPNKYALIKANDWGETIYVDVMLF